jgi:hypothetical protein
MGRTTYEMFEPAWSTRRVEDDPATPFLTTPPRLFIERAAPGKLSLAAFESYENGVL